MSVEIVCNYTNLIKVNKINENPKNRNKHTNNQIERLSKLIEYHGFRVPIIVSNLTGYIVSGHGRFKAAKKLKMKEVPVDYQDFNNLDEEYAFLISDNAISEWSSLDLSGINLDLQDLGPDLDLDLLGLENFKLDAFEKANKVNKGDENDEWVDMPEFKESEKDIKLTLIFSTELERELFVKDKKIEITKKMNGQWVSRA